MVNFKFNLGDRVRSRLTTVEGIVGSRVQYFNGCIQYGVQIQKLDEDGTRGNMEYIDEGELNLIENKAVMSPVYELAVKKPVYAETGGPQPGRTPPR